MASHAYIPLYVDDYEAATAHLTIEEDGIYNRLLRLCWRTPGCSLPNEPAWIARKIRISQEEFDRVAAPVLKEFFVLSRGRLVQRRLKREFDDISRKKTARKEAGKKGGAAKALKDQGKLSSNAGNLPADTRAFPEPEPEPEPIEEKVRALFPVPTETPAAAESAQCARTKGSRLKADWKPGVEALAYALAAGFTEPETLRIGEDFRDYWVAQPGQKGVKVDWPATWRRWVRNQAERRPVPRNRVDWI